MSTTATLSATMSIVQLHVNLFFVGRHIGHLHVGLHVHLHVSHHVGHSNVHLTLCESSETLTKWKSESVTDQRTDRLTGVGARDACLSKNVLR